MIIEVVEGLIKLLIVMMSSTQIFHIVFHNLLYGLIRLIWLCGCIILLGNVLFLKAYKVHLHGNSED
jgi:hypothetical protein